MSDKETSGEIATLAAQVLNAETVKCPSSSEYADLLIQAKRLAGSCLSQRELIDAQAEGTLVLTPEMEVKGNIGNFRIEANSLGGVNLYPLIVPGSTVIAGDDGIETTFQFYVDGYTLQSTDNIGEVVITDYTGLSVTIKSKSLTDFFERRLRPNDTTITE